MRALSAFTLMEMLIALVLVSILTCLAIPAFKTITDAHNDQLLQWQWLEAIQLARQAAYANGATTEIHWEKNLIVLSGKQALYSAQIKQHGVVHWKGFPYYKTHPQFSLPSISATTNGTVWYCHFYKQIPVWAIAIDKFGHARVLNENEAREFQC